MTEIEQKDIDKMKAEMIKIKLNCYSLLSHLNKASPSHLENSGYGNKTKAEAMQMAFHSYERQIKKLESDFFKKYPDN